MAKLSNAQIRDKLASEKAIAATDLQKWDSRTRGGMEGRVREATNNIDKLEAQLKTNLVANAVIIVGTKGVDQSMLGVLAEKNGSEQIDFLELESKLVDAIYRGTSDGFRVGNEFQVRLGNVLRQLANEMGALAIPTPSISANKYGNYKTKAEVVKLLDEAFTRDFGLELKQKYMYVTLDAIANKHVGKETEHVSIVVTNVPENFLPIFNGATNFLIVLSPNVELDGAVLYTEGDSQDDIEARIVEAIKTRKLKGA